MLTVSKKSGIGGPVNLNVKQFLAQIVGYHFSSQSLTNSDNSSSGSHRASVNSKYSSWFTNFTLLATSGPSIQFVRKV